MTAGQARPSLGRGEEGLGRVGALALLLAVVVAVGGAEAGKGSTPSREGKRRAALFEAEASRVARLITGGQAVVHCHGSGSWRAISADLGIDPTMTWAVTPFHWDSERSSAAPDGIAHFSPRACRFGGAFWRAPAEFGARTCRLNELAGRTAVRPVGECEQWAPKLTAVHVLSHESVHLSGFYSEANADCLGVQIDAFVAEELGADARFARSLAREFWTDYYASRSDGYRTLACREGSSLDLFPSRPGWPTPSAYPEGLSSALAALRSRLVARGVSP